LHEVDLGHSLHLICERGPIRRLQVLYERVRVRDRELLVCERQGPRIRLHVITVGRLVPLRGAVEEVDPGYAALRLEPRKARTATSDVDDGLAGTRPDKRTVDLVAPTARSIGKQRPEPPPDAALAVTIDRHPIATGGRPGSKYRCVRLR
jgi:hypothetical protein